MRKRGNKKLKKLLVDLGHTQKQFAKLSGVSAWNISTTISGLHILPAKHRTPIVETLNKMLPPWGKISEESLFGEDA